MIKNYWIQFLVGWVLLFAFSDDAFSQYFQQSGRTGLCTKADIVYKNREYYFPQAAADVMAQAVRQGSYPQCNGPVYYGSDLRPDGTPYPTTELSLMNGPLNDRHLMPVVIEIEAIVARERGFKAVRSSHYRFWGNKVRYQVWDKDQNGKLHYVSIGAK